MIDEDLADQAKEEVKAVEETRFLLGFMSPGEAIIQQHQSYLLLNPVSPEEEDRVLEENRDEFRSVYSDAQSAISSASVSFQDSEVEVVELPDSSEIDGHIEQFLQEGHFQEVVQSMDDEDWKIGQLPIDNIVGFQKAVTKTTYETIPTSEEDGVLEVLKYTLPVGPSNMLMREEIGLPNSVYAGLQLISRDPNVQVLGPNHGEVADQPPGTVMVQFLVRSSPNFAQVVHYRDRYILRNGYHRTYQLLRAGESNLPCVILEVDDWSETGGNQPGHFDENVVMHSDRPPLITDFQSDIASDLYTPARNTHIRIVAETSRARR